MRYVLEIDFPSGSKFSQIFPSEKEAFIHHMYLESEGLDVQFWSIKPLNEKEYNHGTSLSDC